MLVPERTRSRCFRMQKVEGIPRNASKSSRDTWSLHVIPVDILSHYSHSLGVDTTDPLDGISRCNTSILLAGLTSIR